jgi:hypothetical protein
MVVGKIIIAIIAVVIFVVLWRLLDVFLGFTFGILTWLIKLALFVILLYFVYRLLAGRHRAPSPR